MLFSPSGDDHLSYQRHHPPSLHPHHAPSSPLLAVTAAQTHNVQSKRFSPVKEHSESVQHHHRHHYHQCNSDLFNYYLSSAATQQSNWYIKYVQYNPAQQHLRKEDIISPVHSLTQHQAKQII